MIKIEDSPLKNQADGQPSYDVQNLEGRVTQGKASKSLVNLFFNNFLDDPICSKSVFNF